MRTAKDLFVGLDAMTNNSAITVFTHRSKGLDRALKTVKDM